MGDVEIKVPLKKLLDYGISTEEFCILVLLYKKAYPFLRSYQSNCSRNINQYIIKLSNKGFILSKKDDIISGLPFDKIIVDNVKTLKLFGVDGGDENFYKFFSTYPQKVPSRAGGYRALRPVNVESISANNLKKKYFIKVGKKLEEQIKVQNILEADMEAKRLSGDLKYMPAMEAYLNGFQWEKAEYLLEQAEKKKENGGDTKPGEQLI